MGDSAADIHTNKRKSPLQTLLLFILTISYFRVVLSITVLNPDNESSAFAKQSLRDGQRILSPSQDTETPEKFFDSLFEGNEEFKKSLLDQKRQDAQRVFHYDDKMPNGTTQGKYSFAEPQGNVLTYAKDENGNKIKIETHGYGDTLINILEEPHKYSVDVSRKISSLVEENDSTNKIVVRTARAVPITAGSLGPEPYFFTDDDDDNDGERRKDSKRGMKLKEKALPSSSRFFSKGSSKSDRMRELKQTTNPQAIAFIVTPESFSSLLNRHNSKGNTQLINLEEKINSYKSNRLRSRGGPRVVKMNQEKSFTETVDGLINNSHTGKSAGRKKVRTGSLFEGNLKNFEKQNARKNSKSIFDSNDYEFGTTTTLPPFLKMLDVPLNSLNSAKGNDNIEFSKLFKLLEISSKSNFNNDKNIDSNNKKPSFKRSKFDNYDYDSLKFRKNDELPYIKRRKNYDDDDNDDDDDNSSGFRSRNRYDPSEYRKSSNFDSSEYRRNDDYDIAEFRKSKNYDTSKFRKNNDKPKELRDNYDDYDDYSDSNLPPLNFASLLDSYNERDSEKGLQGNNNRKNSGNADDILDFIHGSRDLSSDEGDLSRGLEPLDYSDIVKKLNDDPSFLSKFRFTFINASNLLFDPGNTGKGNRNSFKKEGVRDSTLSLFETLLNLKGHESAGNDETDGLFDLSSFNKGPLSNKFNLGSKDRDRGNAKDKNKKSLADLLSSFKLNSKPDNDRKSNKKLKIPSFVEPSSNMRKKTQSTDSKSKINSNDKKSDVVKDTKIGTLYSTVRPKSFKNVTEINRGKDGRSSFVLKPTKIPNVFVPTTTAKSSTPFGTTYATTFLGNGKDFLARGKNSGERRGLNIPPLPFPSLTPGGSPVFINSTVFVSTTPLPQLLSPIDYIPRIRTPSSLPPSIRGGTYHNSPGVHYHIIPPGHNHALRGLSNSGQISGNLPTLLPGLNPVSNKGLFGINNPLQKPPNLHIPTTTPFPTTKPFPVTLLSRNHPTGRQLNSPRQTTPFSVTSHPTTPHLTTLHPTTPRLTTHRSITPRPTTPFLTTPFPATPFPVKHRSRAPFSATPQFTRPVPTTPFSVTLQPAPFSATPHPTTHFSATPHPTTQFSASPYPTTLLPGTLRPKTFSAASPFPKTPSFSGLPHPTTPLSIGHQSTPFPVRRRPGTLSPNNVPVTAFPNVPHSERFPRPNTRHLVSPKPPVHNVGKQVANNRQQSSRKRLTSRGRPVQGRNRGKANSRPTPTAAPLVLETTSPKTVLTTTTAHPVTLRTVPPKFAVRRLRKKIRRKKKRRFNNNDKNSVIHNNNKLLSHIHPGSSTVGSLVQNKIQNSNLRSDLNESPHVTVSPVKKEVLRNRFKAKSLSVQKHKQLKLSKTAKRLVNSPKTVANRVQLPKFVTTPIPLIRAASPHPGLLNSIQRPTATPFFKTTGPLLLERSPVSISDPVINKISAVPRVKKPTKASAPFVTTNLQPTRPPVPFITKFLQPTRSHVPFITTTLQPVHKSFFISTPHPNLQRTLVSAGTPIPNLRNRVPSLHSTSRSINLLESPLRNSPSSVVSSGTPIPRFSRLQEALRKPTDSVKKLLHSNIPHLATVTPKPFSLKPPDVPLAVHPFPVTVLQKPKLPGFRAAFFSTLSPGQLPRVPVSRRIKGTPTPASFLRNIDGTPIPAGIRGTPIPRGIPGTPIPGRIPSIPIPGRIPSIPVPEGIPGTPIPGGIPGTPIPGGIPGTPIHGGIPGTPIPGRIRGTLIPGRTRGTPTPGGIRGTPIPGGIHGTPIPGAIRGTPRPRDEQPSSLAKSLKPHIPQHRRKIVQDVPVPKILPGTVPYRNAYEPVLFNPRAYSLPNSLLSAVHQHRHSPSVRPLSSSGNSLHGPLGLISPHLRTGTLSPYYGRNSILVPRGRIPIHGLPSLPGSSPLLRKYYVHKTFRGDRR